MQDYDPSELQNPFTSSARPGDFQHDAEGDAGMVVEGTPGNLIATFVVGVIVAFFMFVILP